MSGSLSRLFEPRSIAVIGASAAPEKVGFQLVEALQAFRGEVYPINPKAQEVAGRRAYTQLSDTGEVPDLAILSVPAAACLTALADAAKRGVGAAVIVSGGFAESGEVGARLQVELETICRTSGMRLLGPNTSGFTRPSEACHACFVPAVQHFSPGPLSIVAQSGGVNLTLAFLAEERKLGIRLAVGLGNSVDVDAADVIDYLSKDQGTKVIALHLEGVRKGRRLFEAIAAATKSMPIVVLPVGRADVGDFAQSHTGNLLGAHAVTVAALRQAGAVVVDSTQRLIDCAAAFAGVGRLPPNSEPGVGVLTGQAGPGLIILDALRSNGVRVPELTSSTVAEIARHLPLMTYMQNPVDTGRPSPAFADVLLAMSKDASIDALLTFALDEPAALDPVSMFARSREIIPIPILFSTLGLRKSVVPIVENLQRIGVATYGSPERAATAMQALVEDSKARHRLAESADATASASARVPDDARDEAGMKAFLREQGIPAPRSKICHSKTDAEAAFAELRKPIAVKVLDPQIKHKTEVGGVYLGVTTLDAMRSALEFIAAIPGKRANRAYLLEEMAPPGVDLIVGVSRREDFGTTLMIGLGGAQAEAIRDVSIRLAPVSALDVRQMLGELRGAQLLKGWRGTAAADQDAIVAAVLRLVSIVENDSEVKDLEINPLRCLPDGVLALDALLLD